MRLSLGSLAALGVVACVCVVAVGGCGLDLDGLASVTDGGLEDVTSDVFVLGDSTTDGPPHSCSDGIKDGTETGVDCGGTLCVARCGNGLGCGVGADCQSKVCTAAVCAVPTCTDGAKNGMETDVDCGGPTCPKCGNQKECALPTDCASDICTMMECVPAACADGMKDGNETDTDCGGPDCAPCIVGQKCLVMTDCAVGDYCSAMMKCAARVPLGAACGTDVACASDFCVVGLCCDTPAASCGGCKSCNVPGSVGTCTNVPVGSDPNNACATNMATCESDNCQGDGTCTLPNGTMCGNTTCSAGMQTSYACNGAACMTSMLACAPYACAGNACAVLGGCTDDTECAGGDYCTAAGDCAPQKASGSTCDAATDCKTGTCAECQGSGGCVDGYCCSTACPGACATCSMAGGSSANGTCGIATTGSAGTPSCAPYLCGGASTCPNTCTADTGCAAADYCDQSGHCSMSKATGAACNATMDCEVPASCRECGAGLRCLITGKCG